MPSFSRDDLSAPVVAVGALTVGALAGYLLGSGKSKEVKEDPALASLKKENASLKKQSAQASTEAKEALANLTQENESLLKQKQALAEEKATVTQELNELKSKCWNDEPKICPNILYHIGNTPLVRLNRIGKSLGCEILVKCEFFNAGGSVKDRIGKRMVMDAAERKEILLGDTLIEPTSGNTGIGLSLAAAVLGYKMVITLPKKMSQEKVDVLNALGAIVKRTPTDAPCPPETPGYPYSHIAKAQQICDQLNEGDGRDTAHILDQYRNPSNPLAHIEGTAKELYMQCDGKIDVLVATAGTGGTLAGIAYAFKNPKSPYYIEGITIVGVDPHGSDLAVQHKNIIKNASTDYKVINDSNKSEPALAAYKVEGIGYDFLPKVLTGLVDPENDPISPFHAHGEAINPREDYVDLWYKTSDRDSFIMARRMIREEGLLCGGSCGSSVFGALQMIKDHKLQGKRVVCILSDSVRNYMSKFLSDKWMAEHQFADPCYKPVESLQELQQRSLDLQDANLGCENSWAEQSVLEPENLRPMDRKAQAERLAKVPEEKRSKAVKAILTAAVPAQADDAPAQADDAPAQADDEPAQADDEPAQADDAPRV